MSDTHGKNPSKQLLAAIHQNILLFKSKVKLGIDISADNCFDFHDQLAQLNKDDADTYSYRIDGYSTLLDYIYGWEEINTNSDDIEDDSMSFTSFSGEKSNYSAAANADEDEDEEDDDELEAENSENDELDKSQIILVKTAAFIDILAIASHALQHNNIKPPLLTQLTDTFNQILVNFDEDKALATLFEADENPTEILEVLCCKLLEKSDKDSLDLDLQSAYAQQHSTKFVTEKGRIALLNFALNFGAKFNELNNMLPCEILNDVLPELSNALALNPLDNHEIITEKWQTRQKMLFYFKGEFEKILPKSQWVNIDDGEETKEEPAKMIEQSKEWHMAQFIAKDFQIPMPTKKQIEENEISDYSAYAAVRYRTPEDDTYSKFWRQEVVDTIPHPVSPEMNIEDAAKIEKNYKKFLMN